MRSVRKRVVGDVHQHAADMVMSLPFDVWYYDKTINVTRTQVHGVRTVIHVSVKEERR